MNATDAIAELKAAVQANGDAINSATQAFTILAEKIRAANAQEENPGDAIDALADELEAQAAALSAAVSASGGQASTSTVAQTQSSGGTGNGPAPDSAPQADLPPLDGESSR